MELTSDH